MSSNQDSMYNNPALNRHNLRGVDSGKPMGQPQFNEGAVAAKGEKADHAWEQIQHINRDDSVRANNQDSIAKATAAGSLTQDWAGPQRQVEPGSKAGLPAGWRDHRDLGKTGIEGLSRTKHNGPGDEQGFYDN